jgi:hypothetical protein
MMLQRKWRTSTEIVTERSDNCMNIWDGGSRRYERWPDGTEHSWEIVSRECNNTLPVSEFTEILRELPSWEMPTKICWQETVPFFIVSPHRIQIPGWDITNTVIQSRERLMPSQKINKPIRHR